MARSYNKLIPTALATLEPGLHSDGRGLYLQVRESRDESERLHRSWIFRFMLDRKQRDMGLGPLDDVSLADARREAKKCRALARDGTDPIEARKQRRQAVRVEAAKSVTFKDCAERCIEAKKPEWSNEKHAGQWTQTMEDYAYPVIGHLPVQAVDKGLVLKVLQKDDLWTTKTETATRVRMRLETILNWATVSDYRTGDNPARWKGNLDALLPNPRKVTPVESHPAMPYADLPEFYIDLSKRHAMSALALRFLILTSARSGAVRLATRSEVDLKNALWTVPALPGRKAYGKERLVPLSKEAVAVLRKLNLGDDPDAILFPNEDGESLSENTLSKYLADMGWPKEEATVHGFRSSFRDWAGDRTNYDRETIEFAYGHKVSDKTEAAYRRSTAVDKRRRLMDDWAKYCAHGKAAGGKVVAIRKTK
ncbi:MAG: integrase arm-type DNA-binding domain-containing protein [Xanthobacteraceae bacterium]|nr:integrase arm-type DNA-binding domain-containing protein [Xanthobacteraceae bacterium]